MPPKTKLSEVCNVGVCVKAVKREKKVHNSFKGSIQGFVAASIV
jgi:hypothetical protein